jgi:hypothetical protein
MTLVPSLWVLTLQFTSASSSFLSILSSLGTLCPHLQSMTLRCRPATEDLSSTLSPFIAQSISQLHNLHTLMLWDLANPGMDHIIQLQALWSLDLDLRTSSVRERQSLLPFPGFHHLHYLCLRCGAFE